MARARILKLSCGLMLMAYLLAVLVLSNWMQETTVQGYISSFLSQGPMPLESSVMSHHHWNDSDHHRGTFHAVPAAPQKVISVNGTDFYRVCLQDSCLDDIASQLARPFAFRPKETWCLPNQTTRTSNHHQPINIHNPQPDPPASSSSPWNGILLVKVPKAASSTCAGVILRIAHQSHCEAVQWEHREGHFYQDRQGQQHVLIGSIRQPAQRAFSNVWFFQLAPLNITPTNDNVIRALNTRRGGKTKGKGGYQYDYLSIERVARKSAWDGAQGDLIMNPPERLYQKIQSLVATYHFLIVVERMDESLTALALLLGIDLDQVLVASAKVASGASLSDYYQVRVGRKKGQCVQPRKEPMSPGVRAYFQSDTWLAMNYADELLYRAAQASLDQTIQQVIGKDSFAAALTEYQRLKAHVQTFCGPRHGTGCTAEGTPIAELCYDRDFGCGYPCIDEAVRDYKRQSTG